MNINYDHICQNSSNSWNPLVSFNKWLNDIGSIVPGLGAKMLT